MRTIQPTNFSVGEYAHLNHLIRSKPGEFVAWCKKIKIDRLQEIEAVGLLKLENPHRYEIFVAVARAEGFSIS